MKWWRVVLVAVIGVVAFAYCWQIRGSFTPGSGWMIVPPVVAALAAIVGASWRQHGDRIAWVAIAGSCALTAATFALLLWQSTFGLHDAAQLASVLRAPDRTLVALALLAMIADRSPIHDRYLALEAGIVALATALVMWVAIIEPTLARSTLDSSGRLLSLSLPASDLVLVALGARLSLGYRARSRCFVALQLALVSRFAADMMSYWSDIGDRHPSPAVTDGVIAMSFGFFVWAALDRHHSEPAQLVHNAVRFSRVRLLAIVLSAIAPQIVLVTLLTNGTASHATVLSAAGVAAVVSLLALARLWGLAVSVRNLTERRGNDRLASLVERSSDVVVLVDADGRISYASPALKYVLGYEADEWVGRPVDTLDVRASSELRVGLWMDVRQLRPESSITLEVSALHADGARRTMDLSAVNLIQNVAVCGTVVTLRDVTANRTLEHQLSYRADHDALTGLANRANFLKVLDAELENGQLPTVILIDLDDFTTINEGLGHVAGDVLLRSVADRLAVRFADVSSLVARIGPDEFGILLADVPVAEATALSRQVLADLKNSVKVNDFQSVSVSGCIGIAEAEPRNGAADLLRNVDLAVDRAKQLGKGQVEGFDAELGRQTERRNEYKRDLAAALGRDQLHLVYQPIVRLSDGRTVGAEALLRWDHHIYGNVFPSDFIPLAEQSGVIIPIGAWAIEQACMSAMGWSDDSMFVTVNVSRVQLGEAGFVDGTRRALRLSGLPASRLVLDITESTLVDDRDDASELLHKLRTDGVRIALDDYGTDRSSLSSVQRLPLDLIKIDREIVGKVEELRSNALANTIINMSRNLGLRTIAEGVETEGEAMELARLGCEFAQGYLFFKPLSAVAMTALAEFEQQPIITAPARASSAAFPAPSSASVAASNVPPTQAGAGSNSGSPLPPPGQEQVAAELGQVLIPRDELSHLLRPLLSSSNRRG